MSIQGEACKHGFPLRDNGCYAVVDGIIFHKFWDLKKEKFTWVGATAKGSLRILLSIDDADIVNT